MKESEVVFIGLRGVNRHEADIGDKKYIPLEGSTMRGLTTDIARLRALLDLSVVYLARHVDHNEKAFGHMRKAEPKVKAYFDEMAEHLKDCRAALEGTP